jgi:RNA polymerase sigma-70 factor (ECF subfamily)
MNPGKPLSQEEKTRVAKLLSEAWPQLQRKAARLARNAPDAADLIQATCERAVLMFPAIPSMSIGWLHTVMMSVFVDRYRLARRCRPRPPSAFDTIAAPAPPEAFDRWRTSALSLEEVDAAARTLGPSLRSVFDLRRQGSSYDDIAACLQLSKVTVGTRLTRARRALRRQLSSVVRD